jgi:hypothetical protein
MLTDLNNGFETLIRNKLEDYRISVDPNTWGAIEKSLVRRKRQRYIYAAAGCVAAAVILLLVTLNLPESNNRDNLQDNTVQPDVVAEESTPPTMQPEPEPDGQNTVTDITRQTAEGAKTEQQPQTVENRTDRQQTAANPVYGANTIAARVETTEENPDNPPLKGKLKIVHQPIYGISTNLSSSNKLQLPDNDMRLITALEKKQPEKKQNIIMPDNKYLTDNRDKNGLKNENWSVATSLGAGNYQDANNNKNSGVITAAPVLTSSNATDYVKNQYKNEIMIPDNAESQHGLPLSAKLIVRRNLHARWAVESGLNFTYLTTRYKWNKNSADQRLYYLGIPLNAVYYVVSKPNWNIYASVGGMVEKGIYATIDRSDKTATSRVDMKGLQWSVNGGIGATYKLYRGLGMFFEPQFGYFFDNGQPESIRTEWPVSFGLGIGLRFSF